MITSGQYNQSGKRFEIGSTEVEVTSGAASIGVAFGATFPRPPHVSVVPHEADVAAGASYAASSITTTGFTLAIAASKYPTGGRVRVEWFAAEKS